MISFTCLWTYDIIDEVHELLNLFIGYLGIIRVTNVLLISIFILVRILLLMCHFIWIIDVPIIIGTIGILAIGKCSLLHDKGEITGRWVEIHPLPVQASYYLSHRGHRLPSYFCDRKWPKFCHYCRQLSNYHPSKRFNH